MKKETKNWEVKIEKTSPFILLPEVINKPGVGAKICNLLAEHKINIESLNVFSVPGKEKVDVLIEIDEKLLAKASYFLGKLAKDIQTKGLLSPNIYVEELVTIVVYGKNFAQSPGIAAIIFNVFNAYSINVWAFSGVRSNEIRIWVGKEAVSKTPTILKELKKALSKN